MERTTFGLLFYIRRDKTNKKGEAPVFMRLTINGERADASIKRFIEPHAWNSAKGKANEKSRGGKDLNLYLDAISANILRIQRDLELDKKEISAQIILNRYLGKEQSDRHTLMEVFRAHNEKCRALSGISLAPGTMIRYETTDVQQLKAEHLVADTHDKIWIRKARQKTKNMCNIPLLDEAQKIIDRYREHPYCQTHGMLLPVCSNQKMNSYLKELADICGIRKNLSTHCATH